MAENFDVRWLQRFQSFKRAFGQLSQAVSLSKARALTELEQQGLIQAFEFTHELAWNTLRDSFWLKAMGKSLALETLRERPSLKD